MRVTMMLADAAQEMNGKLYVLGGGWSVTGPDLPPMALAVKLDVPWSEANAPHDFDIRLVTADGHPVRVEEAADAPEVHIGGNFEVGRPPGLPPGSDIDFAFTINVGPLPLASGRYTWQLWIDGATREDWQRPFQVRARG
ncbi:MAG: DUF6941 family protein [Actinomycetes bacterium]